MRVQYSLDTTPTHAHLDIVCTIVKERLKKDDLDDNCKLMSALKRDTLFEKYILPETNPEAFRNWLGQTQVDYLLNKLVSDGFLSKVEGGYIMTDLCYWPSDYEFDKNVDDILNMLEEVRCL